MDPHIPHVSPSVPIDPRPYLEYLDREMRLLGILSTFSVAVAVLIVDRVMNAASGSFLGKLWSNEQLSILICLTAILWAALDFFRQRHYYSFRYGEITREWVLQSEPVACGRAVRDQIKSTEQWLAQRRRRRARLALYLAFVQFGLAVLFEAKAFAEIGIERSAWWLYLHLIAWLVFGAVEHKAAGLDVSVEDPISTWLKLSWEKVRNLSTSKKEGEAI